MHTKNGTMREKIVLGLGDNIDYEIVWDSRVFERLIAEYKIHTAELTTAQAVHSERDLVVSILGFLKSEDGGERFVANSKLLDTFAKKFQSKITLGGTSVRAALAMRKLGFTAGLHLVTLNEHVRRLLPQDCPYICSARDEGLYPHLIVQFTQGTRIQAADIDICTSRSNRIIYDNDTDNIRMELSEELGDFISEAKVLLISGFNAMQSEALLVQRLETLLQSMATLPADARVFYEDACFHTPRLSQRVRDALIKRIAIYSLNEDELQGYLNKKLDLLDPVQIRAALEDIQVMIPAPVIVVHTRFWALAYGDQAADYRRALKGGITMAGTRFRFGDDFSAAEYQETEAYALQEKGAVFADRINALLGDRVCCLACIQAEETRATTIGLGDAFVGGFLPPLIA